MNVSRRFVAMGFLLIVLFLTAVVLTAAPPAQYAPPPSIKPSVEVLKQIEERQDKLSRALQQLRQLGIKDPVLADIEIYSKAACVDRSSQRVLPEGCRRVDGRSA